MVSRFWGGQDRNEDINWSDTFRVNESAEIKVDQTNERETLWLSSKTILTKTISK